MKLKAIGEDFTGLKTTIITHWSDLVMSEELKNLFESGKPQKVLDQFTQNEIQGVWATLPEEEQIACIYYKCRSLEYLGRCEEALQTVTRARTNYSSPKNPSYLLALLAAQSYAFHQLGGVRLDEAQLVVAEGETILETLTDKERQIGAFWIAVFEHVKATDYASGKKELELGIKSCHRALKSFETLNNRHGIAACFHWMGLTYFYKGEGDVAIKYFQRSLSLFEALGNTGFIADCLDGIGNVYLDKSELNTALEYYQRSLSFAEANEGPLFLYFPLIHLGGVHTVKGDFDKALDYFRQALAVVEPLGIGWTIAETFRYIGMAYHQKGALDIAFPFFQAALVKREETKIDYMIVRELFQLILLSLDQQEVEQAQKYLTSLQQVATRVSTELPAAHLRKRLAEALVLKESPRMIEKAQAQTLLRNL